MVSRVSITQNQVEKIYLPVDCSGKIADSWYVCELETSPVLRWVYINKHGRWAIYPKQTSKAFVNWWAAKSQIEYFITK